MADTPFDTDNILIGLPEVKIDNISIGYLMEGTSVDITPTEVHKTFKSGKPLQEVKDEVIEQGLAVKMTFAEINPTNLKYALSTALVDADSVPGHTLVKWGGSFSYVTKQVEVIFTRPDGTTVVWTFFKAVNTSPFTVSHAADAWVPIEVTFTVMKDGTKPDGENLMKIDFENPPGS